MTDTHYLHHDTDERYLSLHDCRAAKAVLENGVLSFFFEDGFWVTQSHPDNPTGRTIRTGPARVDYVLRDADGDDVLVYVFTRLHWPHSLRTSWELPQLLRAINEKGWRLEFLYQYPGGWDRVIDCVLRFSKRPYRKDCQLKLDVQEVIYRWNDLRPEHEW